MIFDLHTDILTSEKNQENQVKKYLKNAFNYGLKGAVLALWNSRECLTIESAKRRIQPFFGLKSQYNLLFSLEDCNFVPQTDIEQIAKLPFDSFGIVWNDQNRFSGGAHTKNGLTGDGKILLKYLQKYQKILDFAHISREGFFEAIDIFEGKMMCSHTCFDSVFSHCRNLTDRQIALLIERGGVIGLTLVSDFLGGGDIDCIIRHIDHFASKFDIDSLCIGTDYFGSTSIAGGLTQYPDFAKLRQALGNHGYSQQTIDGIFYANFTRFYY